MFKRKVSVLAGMLLVASTSAFAVGEWAVDGKITGSPHDLSATVTGVAANGELCVFCHTPHAANSLFKGAPLWNKKSPPAGTSYMLYGASVINTAGSTIAGSVVGAGGTLSSPSLACLSCHDGVSAINSIVNAPGSGSLKDTVNGAGITEVTMVTYVADIGRVNGGNIGFGTAGGDVDMSNDHPVSVLYNGLDAVGGSLTPNNSTYGSPASLRPKAANLEAITGAKWVGGTTIANLLRNDRVECSSCHDPHNGYAKKSEQGTALQVSYLRQTNAGSKLCLGCHDK